MKKIIHLVIVCLVLASALFAQSVETKLPDTVHPYVSFSVSDIRGMGYVNPDYAFGTGVDFENFHWYATSLLSVSTADKIENHSGTLIGAQAFGYRRFVDSRNEIAFLAGFGVSEHKMITSQWGKSGLYPQGSVGVELPVPSGSFRIIASGHLAGTDHLNGVRSASLDVDIPLRRHFSFVFGETWESYYPTGDPQADRRPGYVASGTLKLSR